jgi:hypothetical protein
MRLPAARASATHWGRRTADATTATAGDGGTRVRGAKDISCVHGRSEAVRSWLAAGRARVGPVSVCRLSTAPATMSRVSASPENPHRFLDQR